MTQQILFIQGGGETTHDEWDNKLVESLERSLGSGYEIVYPRMPEEDTPAFERWSAAIGAELSGLNDGALLVGHSIGATILVHCLAEQRPKRPPAGVFLVSMPFIGDEGWQTGDINPKPDLGAYLPAQTPVYLYQGSADDIVPATHLDLNAASIPQAMLRLLPGRDHQLDNDMSEVAADIRGLMSQQRSVE